MEEDYTPEKELLERYRKGLCSPAEQLLVADWFNREARLAKGDTDPVSMGVRDEIWDRLPASAKTATIQVWPRIAVAASIALAIFMAVLFYSSRQRSAQFAYKNDVSPGKQGATLTLASGQKIRLDDAINGQLAREAGVSISKSANGQLVYEIKEADAKSAEAKMNIISTARGETYQVHLSDGSKVWLNAASSLTFSTNLNEQGKRRVKLEGEGYFEVAKDKIHPFVVESEDQEVEVLGTHFNISAYKGEQLMKTTLIEGSVKVLAYGQQKILMPGSEAVRSGNDIQVHNVDAALAIAWKNDKFVFENERIQTVMKMVERWYNVQVIYEGEMPEDVFGGSVSRFDNVSQVLKILESTGRIHFSVEGRKIYVSK